MDIGWWTIDPVLRCVILSLDKSDLGRQFDFGVCIGVFGDAFKDGFVGACEEQVVYRAPVSPSVTHGIGLSMSLVDVQFLLPPSIVSSSQKYFRLCLSIEPPI